MMRKRGSDSSSSNRRFSGKHGQVTIFIIIGISILLVSAAVILITKSSSREKLFGEQKLIETRVPQEFVPLQIYTKNCLTQVGRQGLTILGQQGGYTDSGVLGEYSLIQPTESVGINLEPVKVPYWHFNSEPDDSLKVVHSSLKPNLRGSDGFSVERQLASFVEENIDECLDDYRIFTESLGFEIEVSDVKEVKTSVRNNDVVFNLEMDVKASKGSTSKVIDKFAIAIPLKLKHYYEVAEKILDAQQEFSFLERQGLEILSVYSRKNADSLAPIKEVTYELFSPLSWNEVELKKKFKSLLGSYIPMLKYLGSDNFYYSRAPKDDVLSQRFLDNMVLTLDGANDVDVRFDYYGWEPYFKTNSEDGVVKPSDTFIKFEVLQLGTQIYRTHYDISYPVLVSVYDENAFNGDGYTFNFALEANIRNNNPSESGKVRKIAPRQITNLACGDAHKDTEIIKTVVVDSFSKEPVELVKLGFSIPGMAECDIGQTNRFGIEESKYPSVYGGEINFIKPDYLMNIYPINTYETKDQPLILGYSIAGANPGEKVIEMHHKVDIPVRVKKKLLQKCVTPITCSYTTGLSPTVIPFNDIDCKEGVRQCFFDGGAGMLGKADIEISSQGSISQNHSYYLGNQDFDLLDTEEALITFERVGGFNDDLFRSDSHVTAVNVKGTNTVETTLYPGKYKITGFLSVKEKLIIPKDQRCFKYSIVVTEKEQCNDIDQITQDEYIGSQIDWSIPETYLEITPEDLNTANELTLFLPVQELRSVPLVINTPHKSCGSLTCLPVLGCAFEVCAPKNIPAPGIVVEDLQVTGKISELAKGPKFRRMLAPKWS